jgi:hypothetical protein
LIGIPRRPEYPDFDRDVRRPGAAFLASCPNPTSSEFKKKNFWSRAAKELHAAYSGICAYTAIYLPNQGSVDHFLPKASHPQLAYEWSNFRLASSKVNNIKGNQSGLLDPFDVMDDWFFLEIPTCLIKANPMLDKALRSRINVTINSLNLNSDDSLVQDRCNILIEYAKGEISVGFLGRRYPFLAKEVGRQSLKQENLKALFKV